MKSEYIYYANKAYSNLEKSEELFEKEAYIISYVKCALLRKEDLDDFCINGTSVSVFNTGRGYALYFDGHCIDIDVYEDMIVNLEVE